MKNSAVKILSSSHRAMEELRRLIFSGELAGGSNHLESELALRLNMSRTPIREAALALEAQGLLEMRPRKGVRILVISPDDMREVYEVLTALESVAARNAAQAGYRDAELAELARAIDNMDNALEADDMRAWADADDQFHSELVRLGGNTRIRNVVSMMADQVRRARAMTLFMREKPHKSNEDHRQVLDAIRDGQADVAYRIHHAHRTQAQSTLLDLLVRHHLHSI
ncbi:GntR family transcriptional regulator [Falsihalocynthiibacter arcticus]|uniref:GntR family transcriptional regulator n=1 Tax=Falsihalocynthiibacter arcticus TaxID=1579316 RepID=A0A126V0L2_9RHOB|nr:GntR family transcriptional regulator [Falsihalocynthiibacter arcticus]AML51878.1 GntR family transcriptional regulator [Falsihalocynthiibacter arcticus]